MVRRRCEKCGKWDEADSLRCQECGGRLETTTPKAGVDNAAIIVAILIGFMALSGFALPLALNPDFETIRVPGLVVVGVVALGFILTCCGVLVRRSFWGMGQPKMRFEEIDLRKINEDEEEEYAEVVPREPAVVRRRCEVCGVWEEDGGHRCRECGGRMAEGGNVVVEPISLTAVLIVVLVAGILVCIGAAAAVAFDPKFEPEELRGPLAGFFVLLTLALTFGEGFLIWRWSRKRRRAKRVGDFRPDDRYEDE